MENRISKKYYFPMLIIIVLIITLYSTAFAESDFSTSVSQKLNNAIVLFVGSPNAYLHNEKVWVDSDNMSTHPFIRDGRTLVPARFICESLGAKVDWDDEALTATISLNNNIIKMTVDSKIIEVNGMKKEMDVPANIVNERVFLPLRVISESLDKNVFWDDRGLIVISDNDGVFDAKLDKDLIDEIVKKCEKNVEIVKVEVSSVEELINEIGPNKEIMLNSGAYNLSDYNADNNTNEYVSFEEVYDGLELKIHDVNNLYISGFFSGIYVKPRSANVITFENCDNINLSCITVGHTPLDGSCSESVLEFNNCKNVNIISSDLFGCGFRGLKLSNVDSLSFKDSIIRDCSGEIMEVDNSKNISFVNSQFYNNGLFSLINVNNHSNVLFDNCNIEYNNTYICEPLEAENSLFDIDMDSKALVKDSIIANNNVLHFERIKDSVELENTIVEDNNIVQYYYKDCDWMKYLKIELKMMM